MVDRPMQQTRGMADTPLHIQEDDQFVASELKDPICHSDECQIGSFSSEATNRYLGTVQIPPFNNKVTR